MLKKVLCLLLLFTSAQAYASSGDRSSLASIQALLSQGDSRAGLEQLRQFLKDQPDSYQAWFLLGVNQAEQRQFDDAIVSFHQVIRLKPKLAEPHNNLAVIYNETGKFQAAVNELEASLALKPGYVTAQENIGDLYVKLAADAYRKVLAQKDNPALQRRYLGLLNLRAEKSSAQKTTEMMSRSERPVALKTAASSASRAQSSAPIAVPASTSMSRSQIAKLKVVEAPVQKPTAATALKAAMPQQAMSVSAAEQASQSHVVALDKMDVNPLKQEVLKAVEAWLVAWSNKDMAGYFAAYSNDFEYGEKYVSFAKWKDYKTWAMRQRAFIKVNIEDVHMTMLANDVVKLTFIQHFRSDTFNNDSVKEMLFRKTAGGWKIIYEASI